MKPEELDELVRQMRTKADTLRRSKGQDYSPGGDTLQNFSAAGNLLGITPFQVCLTYLTKHLQALSNPKLQVESAQSRILDVYNYLQFLYALAEERDASRRHSSNLPT